jgi:hypothetical protein
MKRLSILFFLFGTAFVSCKTKVKNSILSPKNLPSFFINVNSDSGYTLKTPSGARITLLPNSFDVPAHTQVQIEIKEAYTMQDILLAGLTTQSNGAPLKSAGMLYFNATVNNKEVKFIKQATAIIPSKNYDSSMQVFKGEIEADSTINWLNPTAVDSSAFLKNIALGKSLFVTLCANCHKPDNDYTGPRLAAVRQRAPYPNWVYDFVKSPESMIIRDAYSNKLFSLWKPTVMTAYPNLKAKEIKAILDYCDNEASLVSSNVKATTSDTGKFKTYACGFDTFYYPKPKETIEAEPINFNTEQENVDFNSSDINSNISSVLPKENSKYKTISPAEGVYQFKITESGWYNIDVLLEEKNADKVKLLAKINWDKEDDLTVYLFLPTKKVLLASYKRKKDIYLFGYSDEEEYLKLIQNDKAIIFATGSVGTKAYYGISSFEIKESQTINVEIKESTPEYILEAFKLNQLDSIKLDIDKKEMEIIEKPCFGFQEAESVDTAKMQSY